MISDNTKCSIMNERFRDFVHYSFETKLTSLELDWACDMTHAVAYTGNLPLIIPLKCR